MGCLEVLGQPAVAADPGEEALDDPASRQHGEADLLRQLADDLDDDIGSHDIGSHGDPLMIVSGIGEDALDEGEERAGGAKRRSTAVAVLDACRVRLDKQATAIGVDERMVDRLEDAIVAPAREPPVGRAAGRKVPRQKGPGDATAQDTEDGVDDLARRPGAGSARGLGRRQVGLDQPPFGVGQIGLVARRRTSIVFTGGRGPHANLQTGINRLESLDSRPHNPFRNGLLASKNTP
jgi:hypothetical protein